MSGGDETISSGQLPGLVSIAISTPPSISTTAHTVDKTPPRHVTLIDPRMTGPPAPTAPTTTEDFTALHKALGSNGLVRTTVNEIPTLTGAEDYLNWSNHVIGALRYCKIDKILTGEWPKPTVTPNDKDSKSNASEWDSLDAWIGLNLKLSPTVKSKVRHLKTLNEIWEELKKLFMPTSATDMTLHLISIIHSRYDETMEFDEFVTTKCEHNRLLGELGSISLPDTYIAIIVRASLPDHLKQLVSHISGDKLSTDQLITIIRSRQQESQIQTMQSSSSDTALLGRPQHQLRKKPSFEPCKTPGCRYPKTHPTTNCWAPGGPKHDSKKGPRKSNRRGKEKAHKADSDREDDSDTTSSMKIYIDRSFVAQQSDSDLLYLSSTASTSSTSSTFSSSSADSSTSPTPQAYITKGPVPIIIDSGTTSH